METGRSRTGSLALLGGLGWGLVAVTALGCDKGHPNDGLGRLQAGLTIEDVSHDVTGIHYKIVAGGGCDALAVKEQTVPMEKEPLPVSLQPGGAGALHAFADALFILKPGAYLVCATPMAGEVPSKECAPVQGKAVVVAGGTAEVLLVSQCKGATNGGLDIITALNDPPRIDDLRIRESKFITMCETATLSLDASDPNGDKLTFAWKITSGPAGASITPAGNPATFKPGPAGDYEISVVVTDVYGASTALTFPIHVSKGNCLPVKKVYTTNKDFDEGKSINVVHEIANQLQLDDTTQAFGFVWIAASARGTIVKIDSKTGEIKGEYWSSPDGRARNPSRTTVDVNGSVWASNRDEWDVRGSVVHIGLLENNRCVDRNGNGVIDTSTGLGDIRKWSNAGSADDNGGVTTAEDECIIHYTRVAGTATRHLSLDKSNNLWTGGLGNSMFELVDGATGIPVPGTAFTIGCGGYGGVTDLNGVIWSAPGGLFRFDPAAGIPTGAQCLYPLSNMSSYGLALDKNTGHVWFSDDGGARVVELDPVTSAVLNTYPFPPEMGAAQGLAVDSKSHVWVAQIFGSMVGHWAPDPANPGKHVYVGAVLGFAGTTGVAVAADGKIWASEMYSSETRGAARIDPNAGPIGSGGYPVGAIDLTVGLDRPNLPPAAPYNYSDMTGSTLIGAPQAGTWTVVWDTAVATGVEWGVITWNSEPQGGIPADAKLIVEARSSTDQITWSAWETATMGGDLTIPDGRYIEVRVTFKRASSGASPVLSDISLQGMPKP